MLYFLSLGIVAGGGRIDKPILKAGRSYHKFKAKRKSWPIVRGVCMNVRFSPLLFFSRTKSSSSYSPLTIHSVVVTINTSANPPQSAATLHQVAKSVSSPLVVLVVFVVLERSKKTKRSSSRRTHKNHSNCLLFCLLAGKE